MTREIKFSYLWQHKEQGRWLERVFTLEDMEHPNAVNIIRGFRSRWTLVARRQFTGLKDKNGKPVFEGDVVRLRGRAKGPDKGEVIYSEKATRFAVRIRRNGYSKNETHLISLIQCEIIGNVWESPELLKETTS